jgi:hypothetical protein
MFGGHEAGKYVMQYPDEPSSGKMCCKLHDEVTPEKVFLRTGEWGEQLTLAENYHPEPVFTVPVGTEVRTRSGVFPSVPYVKQQDGSWKPKYGTE